ncbi:MAG TPA: TetR/AcrR family transcriptional regulator [Segetibacter sp.]|jgi:AcrR family transcriptional regulator
MSYSDKQMQILTTAEGLFSTKGFDGTSVRDIAEEAGVNIAMISYYFGSKEKLMEALFEQRTSDVKFRIETLLQDESITPLQKIESIVDDYIERVMEKQNFFKIMICEQVINKNPAIIHLIYDLKKRNTEEINRLVKDGQEKGAFKKNIDVMLVLNTVIGNITQMMITMDYYREFHGLQAVPEDQFCEQIKQKLSEHIKVLIKVLISNEA